MTEIHEIREVRIYTTPSRLRTLAFNLDDKISRAIPGDLVPQVSIEEYPVNQPGIRVVFAWNQQKEDYGNS